jgi:hypothetical protein
MSGNISSHISDVMLPDMAVEIKINNITETLSNNDLLEAMERLMRHIIARKRKKTLKPK